MRSFKQLKAWEEIVISYDDEEARLKQITVSNSSGPSTSKVGFLSLERKKKGLECELG